MTIYRKIRHRIISVSDKVLHNFRRKQLNNTDFTIICNNCWAGYVYRRYGLPYNTPTVGLYFFAEDFCKLCENLRYYMEQKLEFISYQDSKWKNELIDRQQTDIPLGKLGDIEIIFLHYKTEEEAREKWERRAARINYDNLIFKFSQMNLCGEKELRRFDKLDANKKFAFTATKYDDISSSIYIKGCSSAEKVDNDTLEYSKYISLKKLINSRIVCGNNFGS